MRAHLVRDIISAGEYAEALNAWQDGGRLQGRPGAQVHVMSAPDPVAKSIARAIRRGRIALPEVEIDEAGENEAARAEFEADVESATQPS